MTLIERTQSIEEKEVERLAELIGNETDCRVGASDIKAAFVPPRIEEIEGEEPPFLPTPSNILAFVTHDYKPRKTNYDLEMKNWIPGIKGGGWPAAENPKIEIWNAFGITAVRYLDSSWYRIGADKRPQTEMCLKGVEPHFVFTHDRDSEGAFVRLTETIWAIAMLPESVLNKALEERHFFLMSYPKEEGKLTIASITRGTFQTFVEDGGSSSVVMDKYKRGELEPDTPVVLFQHG